MKVLLLGLSLLALGLQDADSNSGSIHGVVVDDNGRPAVNVHVTAYGVSYIPVESKGFAWAGPVPGAITADDGSFVITGAPQRIRYWLSAHSEERNVPDLDADLYTQPNYKRTFVDLLSDHAAAPVRVELPAPVGRLNGTLVDIHTGLPAHVRGQVKLTAADKPAPWLSIGIHEDGRFSLLIPNRPVFLEVTAEGCEPWRYTDPTTREAVLTIPPGRLAQQTIPLDCAAGPKHSR